MQCPECGYQLTPFDKDCPRCRNFASKGLKAAKPEPIELNFEATPTDSQPTPTIVAYTEETSSRTTNRKRMHPVLVVAVGLLVLLLGSVWVGAVLFLSQQKRGSGSTGVGAVQQNASSDSEVERIKSEGLKQCIAGDKEGCTYAMDKLRDAGDYDSAEYLKWHIIVSLTLNDEQSEYQGNVGATTAEYEAYSNRIADRARYLAITGDVDYKILAKGSDCAKALAQYGKSHKLTGRY